MNTYGPVSQPRSPELDTAPVRGSHVNFAFSGSGGSGLPRHTSFARPGAGNSVMASSSRYSRNAALMPAVFAAAANARSASNIDARSVARNFVCDWPARTDAARHIAASVATVRNEGSGGLSPLCITGDCPLLMARAGDDLEEALDVERGAADERAIDVGLADQLLRVVGLHAAAVDHVACVGRGAAEPLAQPLTDVRVRLLRLDRRRGPAGADRPDRLVRDHERADLLAGDGVEPSLNLAIEDGHRRAGLALGQRLADADDRNEVGGNRGADLPVHHLVGLAEQRPPLRVADDHVLGARLLDHRA